MPVRLARVSDAPSIQAIYSPYVRETCISFEEIPPTVEEMERRIEKTLARLPWLVFERDEEVLGYAYASPHRDRAAYRWSVDVAVYVKPFAHRSGVGRALYSELFDLLTRLGYYNVFAGITLPNAGSVGLHESMGFQPVGVYRNVGFKFGRWHDTGWWRKPLRTPEGSPEDPVLLPALELPVG